MYGSMVLTYPQVIGRSEQSSNTMRACSSNSPSSSSDHSIVRDIPHYAQGGKTGHNDNLQDVIRSGFLWVGKACYGEMATHVEGLST